MQQKGATADYGKSEIPICKILAEVNIAGTVSVV
jgi:hypothetical protein